MTNNNIEYSDSQKRFSEWLRIGLQIFFLRYKTFLTVFIGTVISIMLLSFMLPSLYFGHFSILVKSNETDTSAVLPDSNVQVRGGYTDAMMTIDEQNILIGSTLAKKVVDRMKTQYGESTAFGWLAKAIPLWITNLFEKFGNAISWVLLKFGLSGSKAFSPDPLVEDFKGTLTVEPVIGSNVIDISVYHYDPLFLENLLKVLLEEYLSLRESIWITDKAPSFFRELADYYWKEWEDTGLKQLKLLEDLSLLVPSHDSKNIISQINKVEGKILELGYDEKSNKNILDHIEGIDINQIETYQALNNNSNLQNICNGISKLEIERISGLKLFLEAAPSIQKIDRELLLLRKKYKNFIVEYYKNNLAIIEKEKVMLLKIQEDLRQKFLDIEKKELNLTILSQKAEIIKNHVNSYEKKFHETKISNAMKKSMRTCVGISSFPYVGLKTFPRKKMMLILSFGMGIFMGCFVIAVKELLDDSYKIPEQINKDLNLMVLASLPIDNNQIK